MERAGSRETYVHGGWAWGWALKDTQLWGRWRGRTLQEEDTAQAKARGWNEDAGRKGGHPYKRQFLGPVESSTHLDSPNKMLQ